MIRRSTILTAVFLIIVVFLVREFKKTTLNHEQEKELIKQDSEIKEAENLQLKESNNKLTEEIKVIDKQIDSLAIINEVKEYKLQKAKKKITHESTKAIVNAPDTTIIRILSEHNIKTIPSK